MGSGVAGRSARQHPDLTVADGATRRGLRVFLLALLALDGVLTALAAAFFLPMYLGTVPFPVSAVVAGAVNMALVWVALQWTSSPRLAGLPLWTFLATVVLMLFVLPGGDIIFGDAGLGGLAVLLLAGVGAMPGFWVWWRATAD